MECIGKLATDLWNLTFEKAKKWYYLRDNLRSLETKLEGLSGRKSDLESQVTNAERSGTKKRKSEVANWFEKVANIEDEFGALKTSIEQGCLLKNAFSGGDRVAEMDATVEGLIKQSKDFGELCLGVFESRGKPRVTTKLFGEKFDRDLKDILSILRIGEKLDTNEILRIGIWGMGGVGKTTLAEHIHNHLLKNTQSLRVYWVSVSQDFTIKGLQGDVAKRLGLDLSHEDDEKVRARKLGDTFEKMEEMVVLILDDVWEEFRLNSLGIGARNCRLILTTRSLEVCNRMRCQSKFELKTLDTEEAWGLFERTLGSETVLDGGLKDTAKSVAKRCGGLPLGIVVMAGSMIGVTDIHEWRNALVDLNRVEHGKMEEKVSRILERSFDRLDKYERNCFLYCCLYPEDSDIKRKELIVLFIRAELMSKRESWSEEFDQGHTILNKLIRVCLLEKTTDDCVKMHDLVRDMAIRITHGNSKPESSRDDVPRFLVKSLGKGNSKVTQNWTEDLHAVSFYSQNFKEIEIPPAWSPNCPKLSTLLLSWVSIKEIPDSFFRHMCGLKVLNLSLCKGITELPNSVSDMVNLTALILRSCSDLQSVPPLGKLKQLRDLDLSSTKIEDLPEGWESLVNLERLNLDECRSLRRKIIIPKETFSKLTRLQWLALPLYGRVQVNDPEVLNQLECFKGYLSLTNFYKITRWPKYYMVYINDILTKYPFYGCGDQKQLYFHQCELGRGSNNLPDDMECLVIEDCEGMGIRCLSDVFKNFINLSHLSELYIKDLVGIEFLWQLSSASPRDQLEVSYFSPLCDLQVLSLSGLPNLVGLFYGESEPSYLLPAGTFSSLKYLWISECHNMKQLFTVQLLQNLQNLELLDVKNCEGLEEIAADGNGEGQGGGEGTQLTSCEGATATVINLPKLRRLHLDNLPQLKNVCKAAMICNSIEDIAIFGCPNLKRLPSFLSAIDGPPNLLPAGTFSFLRVLWISKCHNMKQLFTVQLLQSLQNLEELHVCNCEGLEEIAADGNGVGQGGGEGTQLTSCEGATATVINRPKLRRLHLRNLPQLKNVCKAAMICESIEDIAIFGCPNLKRLPSFLSAIDGPPYLLPAGTFSSLKKLSISKCHNMKQLFTVQLLQSLQNLETLTVIECEGLEEIAADGNGVGQGGGEGTQLTSSEGATATVVLPKLRLLHLGRLPQLKNICKAALICDSIKEIAIFNCPNLKRLPSFLSTINGLPSVPTTLHKIRGDKEWWESLEWDNSYTKNALDPFITTTDRRQDLMIIVAQVLLY
ncbi:probable disease resistance protein At4g27220 isoform X2 [Coffea arabica]|uniref:Probable disease resistance protein At4g27220 isoform X2 n=1 Tax=Coffea arabica TaxID=13443 RepID=A0ABM4UC29_COFAR